MKNTSPYIAGINRRQILCLLSVLILLYSAGCTISTFEGSGTPNGTIQVSAFDSTGAEITNAAIYIDGSVRPEETPAYIHGISPGAHQVIVKRFSFWNDTSSVSVIAADTTVRRVVFRQFPAGAIGVLNYQSQPAGAQLIINEHPFKSGGSNVVSPGFVTLPWGEYSISAYLPGNRTLSPLLPQINLGVGDTARLDFLLSALSVSSDTGNLAPQFRLATDANDTVAISDLIGHVVLITFFTGDCKPCMEEFPGIESVFKAHTNDGFRVLAINPKDNVEALQRIRTLQNVTFQMLLDPGYKITVDYSLTSFPLNVLIDRTGVIRERKLGLKPEELEEMIAPLL